MDACAAASNVSVMYPPYAVTKKSLLGGKETVTVPKEMWEQRWVSANERSILQKATERFEGPSKTTARAAQSVTSMPLKKRYAG